MGRLSRGQLGLVIALIVMGVAVPPGIYAYLIGRSAGISAPEARRLIDAGSAVLVDVGVSPQSSAAYVQGSVRWPLASILQARGAGDMPAELRGRKLLLVCTAGVRSAQAAVHLRQIGVTDAFSIRGGMQEWISTVPGSPRGVVLHGSPSIDASIPAFRVSPGYEQWAAVLTFFGVKFVYSAISAFVIAALWRRKEGDLVALRWAMIFFFVGEAFCFINVMVFFEHSVVMEHLHSVGMVLAFAATTYALLEGFDQRLIHYSDDARCAATGLCRGCIKNADVACGLRRLFLLLVPATAVLAAIPLLAPFRDVAYNTRILGVLHTYTHPIVHQIYELRYLPAAAIVLLAACFCVLWLVERHPVPISKILFSAAAGAIGFSFFRLALVAPFVDNQVWFAAWEETTELLYVGMVGGVLLVFSRSLLAPGVGTGIRATARPAN